jgi:hypothetical protein
MAAKEEFAKVRALHEEQSEDAPQKMSGGLPPLKL